MMTPTALARNEEQPRGRKILLPTPVVLSLVLEMFPLAGCGGKLDLPRMQQKQKQNKTNRLTSKEPNAV